MDNKIVDQTQFKEIKLLDKTVNGFRFLLFLSDGRMASIGEDDEVKIYEPKKDYTCTMSIKTGQVFLNHICQLPNGQVVTCGELKFKIWNVTDTQFVFLTAGEVNFDIIKKAIPLPNAKMALISDKGVVEILGVEPPYSVETLEKSECYEKIDFYFNDALYIQKKNILLLGGNNDKLIMWNLDTFESDLILNVTDCVHQNTLIELDEERVMFGSFKAIVIINVTEKKIDKIINNDTLDFIWTFIKLRDGNILVGNNDGLLSIYNVKTDEITPLKKNLQKRKNIYYLLNLNDHQFVSCSQELKIWEY